MIPVLIAIAAAADTVPDIRVDGQLYRPPFDASDTLWADDTTLNPGFALGAGVGYVHEPVVWVWDDGERAPLVGDAVGLDVLASYTIWRIRAGLDVPVYLLAEGNGGSGAGLGDVALDVKGVILERKHAPIGLAVSFRGDLPTASTAVPLAADGFAYELSVIADRRFGPLLVAANLGTRGLPQVDAESVQVSDQLAWRLGAGYSPDYAWGASVDLAGYATWSDLGNGAGAPAEVMLGAWGRLGDTLRLSGGVGHGISSGIGASAGRVVLGLGWRPAPAKATPEPVTKVEPRPKPPAGSAVKPTAPVELGSSQPTPTPPPAVVAKVEPTPPTVAPVPNPAAVQVKVMPVRPTPDTPVVVDGSRLRLLEPVSFTGETLTPAGERQLQAVAKYLVAHPEITSVRIEGHTAGTGDANDELGTSGIRAGVALEYLVKQGLSRDRFYAAGYGSMRPVVPGSTAEAMLVNERIDFVVTSWAEGAEPR